MKNLFLISLDNKDAQKIYLKTIKKNTFISFSDITQKHIQRLSGSMLWGLIPTKENKKIWSNIKSNDIILFLKNKKIISKYDIIDTIYNHKIAANLWKNILFGKERSLLIFLDKPKKLNIDTKYIMRYFYDSSLIPKNFHFPIKQAKVQKIDTLFSVFGSFDDAFNAINIFQKSDKSNNDRYVQLNDVYVDLSYTKTLSRIGQEKFRKNVLKNYKYQCAICGIKNNEFLEASHILPVAKRSLMGSLKNGISLCNIHHKMFDHGYLSFDDNFRLIISKYKKLPDVFINITKSGHKMIIPSILPDKKLLEIHRSRFQIS